MKKSIILLVIFIAAQTINGQSRYDAMLSSIALSARGDNEEAVSMLTREIVQGATAGLYILRGDIYFKEGRTKEATSDFMAAENLSQGSGLYGLAECAAVKSDAKAATAYLESHLKSDFKKSEPEILLDNAFERVASSPEWKALWKKEWYKGYERMQWEITHFISIGRIDLADDVYVSLAADYPGMPVTEYCDALLEIARGQYRAAIDHLSPLTETQGASAAYLTAMASAQAGNGNYYASATIYSKLIGAEYPDPKLYLHRAEMLFKAGDSKGSIADLKKYLGYFPDDFEALSLVGKAYANEGSIYDALPYLNLNIEKHPGEAQSFSLRGDAWFASHSWDKAAEDYTMSLDLDPNSAAVNLNLGIALINCGKAQDACHYLKKARDLGEKGATTYLSKYCIR